MRLEICGGIASGKSTLAGLIQSFGVCAQYERFQDNPFFEKFYADPLAYSFETEISYLLQHFSQIREQASLSLNAFDFSLALDLAYARVTMTDGADQKIFEQVLTRTIEKVGPPALILRLNCPSVLELQRIEERHRIPELSIRQEFLETLDQAIEGALKSRWFSAVPILNVDSSAFDFREGGADREAVWAEIRTAIDA